MTFKKTFSKLLLATILCASFSISAQVTIGSGEPPHSFSVLELIGGGTQGLRLPQMCEDARDDMVRTDEFQAQKEGLAVGLQIFNTTRRSVETWDGEDWISHGLSYMLPISCGAYIAPGVWREFMCHNLGADTSLDPFIPHAGLHGAMFKWGTGLVAMTAQEALTLNTQAQVNATGQTWAQRGGGNPPTGAASWNMAAANPCPEGFRVPTQAEWAGVVANNPVRRVGTWTANNNPYPQGNFSSGTHFGDALFLPAAGLRNATSGAKNERGSNGRYWSVTPSGTNAFSLFLTATGQTVNATNRASGFPVRCIAEK